MPKKPTVKLRIVTNGVEFAVEVLCEVGFWNKRMEWRRDRTELGAGLSLANTYGSIESARRRLLQLKDDWTVVEDTNE